jgi:hypothetical protein
MTSAARTGSEVPDLRMLGYHERKPMLRIIRLQAREFEPAPTSLDTGYALDYCLRREGWIAFRPNLDVWGLPTPLNGDPFLVAKSASWAIGADPSTIWLTDTASETGRPIVARLYDGLSRSVIREVELPLGFRPCGETTEALILRRDDVVGLFEWRERRERPEMLVPDAAHIYAEQSSRFACAAAGDTDDLIVVDAEARTTTRVPLPDGASRWELKGAFSSDGSKLAIAIDYSPQRTMEELLGRLSSVVSGASVAYERAPRRLAVVDSLGKLALSDDEFDNFAWPVWSVDGDWLVFNAPFQARGLWIASTTDLRLQRIPFKRNPPVPLMDASDLVR